MVKCKDCGREMKTAKGCNCRDIVINGTIYKRNTKYGDVNSRCHDCGRVNSYTNLHHFGCDMERCPRCHKQLIACDCDKQYLICKNKLKKVY